MAIDPSDAPSPLFALLLLCNYCRRRHHCAPQDIVGRFPDLMEGFNRFLARCETMDAVDNEMRGQFGSQRGISQREMARLKGVSAR